MKGTQVSLKKMGVADTNDGLSKKTQNSVGQKRPEKINKL